MASKSSTWRLYGLPLVFIAAAIVTPLALARAGATDFRIFYQSGRQLLERGDPYLPFAVGPNLNPPWIVAAMAPLSRLSLSRALATWWAIGFACLFASATLTARVVSPSAIVCMCALLATQAAFSNLGLGQVAWPLMLLVTAAWWADRTDRRVWFGILIGLAISWKPFLLVFVPYAAARRMWRSLMAMIAVNAATVLGGLAAVGASGYRSWLQVLASTSWGEGLLNASLRGMVSRALSPPPSPGASTSPLVVWPAIEPLAWGIPAVLIVAAVVFVAVRSQNLDRTWATLCLLAVVLSPLGWVHYVSIGTGPLAATLRFQRRAVISLALIGWLLLCVPYLWLRDLTFGPLLTLTLASSYTWGTLLLLAATLLATGDVSGPEPYVAISRTRPCDTSTSR